MNRTAQFSTLRFGSKPEGSRHCDGTCNYTRACRFGCAPKSPKVLEFSVVEYPRTWALSLVGDKMVGYFWVAVLCCNGFRFGVERVEILVCSSRKSLCYTYFGGL